MDKPMQSLPQPRLPSAAATAKTNVTTKSVNVTVREVETDNDTFLRYADQPMIAFVMFFSQHRTAVADRDMEQMTRELIDAALHSGGRYYLPYRLHASVEQFRSAYPRSVEFFRLKQQYDPKKLFENEFYMKYASP